MATSNYQGARSNARAAVALLVGTVLCAAVMLLGAHSEEAVLAERSMEAVPTELEVLGSAEMQAAHHTSQYPATSDTVFVRRGGSFSVKLSGSTVKTQGSKMSVKLAPFDAPHLATTAKMDGNVATFEVPVGGPVGLHHVTLEGKKKTKTALKVHVLFSPWDPKDPVYLPSALLLKEHLLEEAVGVCTGKTCGSLVVWPLDQYTKTAVEAVNKLVAKVPISERTDPWLTARAIAWMVNTKVLKGRWASTFPGGTDPTSWDNSIEILAQWLKTNKIVKYGQCWVFAGVLSSLLRSLGIPTRTVTTERASIAHKRPFDGEIRRYWRLDASGKTYDLDTKRSDGMWYYHVWIDIWMMRYDLGKHMTVGWQALDATPQKWAVDKGHHWAIGPASLDQIKEAGRRMDAGDFATKQCQTAQSGQTACKRNIKEFDDALYPYNMAFILAEVNADKRQYITNSPRGRWIFHAYYKNTYGIHIMTQKPASPRGTMIDVACDYKANCGHTIMGRPLSPVGLLGVASQELRSYDNSVITSSNDVQFLVVPPPTVVDYGKPVTIQVKMGLRKKDHDAASRTVYVTVTAATILDRDVEHDAGTRMDKITHTVKLSADAPSATVEHTVQPHEYSKWLQQGAHDSLLFAVTGQVQETGQTYATLDALPTVKLAVPPLQMALQRQSSSVVVQVAWTNSVLTQLCGCSMKVHLVGSEHTETQAMGCLKKDAQMTAHAKFSLPKNAKASANAMMTCDSGISTTGFVSA